MRFRLRLIFAYWCLIALVTSVENSSSLICFYTFVKNQLVLWGWGLVSGSGSPWNSVSLIDPTHFGLYSVIQVLQSYVWKYLFQGSITVLFLPEPKHWSMAGKEEQPSGRCYLVTEPSSSPTTMARILKEVHNPLWSVAAHTQGGHSLGSLSDITYTYNNGLKNVC